MTFARQLWKPQAAQNEALLSVFRDAEGQRLSLSRQSYTWAVVALKRCDRPDEALAVAADLSQRGIAVSGLFFFLVLSPLAGIVVARHLQSMIPSM